MQIECSFCSARTQALPACGAPLCADCCARCRRLSGGCQAENSAEKPPETARYVS